MRHKAPLTKAKMPEAPQWGLARRGVLGRAALTSMVALGLQGCGFLDFQWMRSSRQRELDKKMNQALAPLGARVGDPIFVRVFKVEAILEMWVQPRGKGPFVKFKDFPICSYSGKLGPKQYEGDLQAPEGFYTVTAKQLNPNSQYHRSFNLGFPNMFDQMHGRTGSYLMVHGDCVSVGCYAMTDEGIDEIYTLVSGYLERSPRWGERSLRFFYVHAFPFIPTAEKMAQMQALQSPWVEFWSDMWRAYDAFNATQTPPRIGIRNKRYTVTALPPA